MIPNEELPEERADAAALALASWPAADCGSCAAAGGFAAAVGGFGASVAKQRRIAVCRDTFEVAKTVAAGRATRLHERESMVISNVHTTDARLHGTRRPSNDDGYLVNGALKGSQVEIFVSIVF